MPCIGVEAMDGLAGRRRSTWQAQEMLNGCFPWMDAAGRDGEMEMQKGRFRREEQMGENVAFRSLGGRQPVSSW